MPGGSDASAAERLRQSYLRRHAAAREAHAAGRRVVGVTSHTAPYELLAASGMLPLMLSAEPAPASGVAATPPPAAEPAPHEEYMEHVFDDRTRGLFDLIAGGDAGFLAAVIVPRTSEQEHKLFLYIKEVQRQGASSNSPKACLFNLLHTRTEAALEYSLDRAVELKGFLEAASGAPIDAPCLERAIEAGNAARNAARQIESLRSGDSTRLSGEDAMAMLAARYFMDAGEYAALASDAAQEVERRAPLAGPRVLIKGRALDCLALHREIESHGAVVVGEDDPWGSRGATADIEVAHDPLRAIVAHYHSAVTSPRVFPPRLDEEWFERSAPQADGVVFYLPPSDDVLGWEHPRQSAFLDSLGVPHLLVRVEASDLTAAARGPAARAAAEAIAAFIASLPARADA